MVGDAIHCPTRAFCACGVRAHCTVCFGSGRRACLALSECLSVLVRIVALTSRGHGSHDVEMVADREIDLRRPHPNAPPQAPHPPLRVLGSAGPDPPAPPALREPSACISCVGPSDSFSCQSGHPDGPVNTGDGVRIRARARAHASVRLVCWPMFATRRCRSARIARADAR